MSESSGEATETLDCAEALEQLHDYLKRELTDDVAARIRAHIDRCAPCFTHLRFQERFLTLLQTPAAGVRCPDTLRSRIAEALRTETAGH